MTIETLEEHRCFGGRMGYYRHASEATGTPMTFAVFTPPQADAMPGGVVKVPALYYLAGLTCSHETFPIKAGAQRRAAQLGLMLVAPDTSPRGLDLPGEHDDWDFGSGAGFYLDATAEPWSAHYRMASYVGSELPALVERHFAAIPGLRGITGHSMGGHGALVTALRNPGGWRSVSALAPIANPVTVPWGEKAFSRYLGQDRDAWAEWDACLLLRRGALPGPILVDQGLEDPFLEAQLHPAALEDAAASVGQDLTLRRHRGYDHSYWFVQSVIADHLDWHARQLGVAVD